MFRFPACSENTFSFHHIETFNIRESGRDASARCEGKTLMRIKREHAVTLFFMCARAHTSNLLEFYFSSIENEIKFYFFVGVYTTWFVLLIWRRWCVVIQKEKKNEFDTGRGLVVVVVTNTIAFEFFFYYSI